MGQFVNVKFTIEDARHKIIKSISFFFLDHSTTNWSCMAKLSEIDKEA